MWLLAVGLAEIILIQQEKMAVRVAGQTEVVQEDRERATKDMMAAMERGILRLITVLVVAVVQVKLVPLEQAVRVVTAAMV